MGNKVDILGITINFSHFSIDFVSCIGSRQTVYVCCLVKQPLQLRDASVLKGCLQRPIYMNVADIAAREQLLSTYWMRIVFSDELLNPTPWLRTLRTTFSVQVFRFESIDWRNGGCKNQTELIMEVLSFSVRMLSVCVHCVSNWCLKMWNSGKL